MTDLAARIARLSPEKRALLERRMKTEKSALRPSVVPIAVVGLGCRFPRSAVSPNAYWTMLENGVDAVREVPSERWDADALYDPDSTVPGKMSTRWGGFLDQIDGFDPAFFDITDREAVRMDPQQRLLLETVWEALEDAGLPARDIAGTATGVFIGAHNVSSDYFIRQLREHTDIDAYSATGGAHSVLANRLSFWLDLQGPSLSVDTACSASLVATHLALNSLRGGECDLAIAGGANLMLSPETNIALSGMQMMAPDGRCKTFDARANGFVRGEGCGAVILKRLEDAQRDGDPIYALIRGSAVNQDGHTNGLTAPNGLSQQKVLTQALRQAGVDPADVGYVEAHGTGTSMGDPIEVEALAEVLGRPADGIRCAMGSVKTNIGHLEGAAGIAGLIKAILCLHREFIPPNLHFTKLNPHISLENTRLVVPTEGMPWPTSENTRFAGVSSFGFGGTNAHIVLEEAPRTPDAAEDLSAPAREPLLLLSARDRRALGELAAEYADVIEAGDLTFQDICYTAACRRTHHEYRLAVPLTGVTDAAAALRAYRSGEVPAEVIEARTPANDSPRAAWVFSGQGSQRVGMGSSLLETEPVFRQTIERIDELLSGLAGWSLLEVLKSADEERLSQTEIAQPAIFAVEVGIAELLRHYGVRPDAVVGHSLGEVAAACIGGALTLEDAVTVIYHRGRLMQRLHGAGRMAAVSASAEEVSRMLATGHDGVTIAAVNGPLSVTVSGDSAAVGAFVDGLEIPHQVLPVEYAFHSAQTEPLCAELVAALAEITVKDPAVPIYSTVRGGLAQSGDFGRDYWALNVRQPVAFAAAIGSMAQVGTDCFVELGPQAVLGPAIEQTVAANEADASVVAALLRGRAEQTREVLASLHVKGFAVDWAAYFESDGRAVRLPTYPWQRHSCWFEPTVRSRPEDPSSDAVRNWGYQIEWLLRTPLDGWIDRPPVADPVSLETVTEIVNDARDRVYGEHGAKDSTALVDALESKAVAYAALALRELGFSLKVGDSYGPADIDAVTSGYRKRIVGRLFRLLGEHGVVVRKGKDWEVCGQVPETDRQFVAEGEPGSTEIIALLDRCGEQVANVVKEQCDPLSLLFPGDYRTSAEWVYADAPFSRVANDLVGETVTALVDQLPDSGTLRVLEIGAGTGGTTRTVLPRLPEDRTEYVFTDLSQSFLNQANERFASSLPIHYGILDLEVDPVEQGFAKGQFDLIIAANVVHATADLRLSLQHARDLLAPGGALLLLEGTARRGWVDLTFGLTEGWWRFTDTEVRDDHPLLAADEWQSLLKECGFADVTSVAAERDSAGCPFEQAIVLATAPNTAAQQGELPVVPATAQDSSAPWIVFGSADGHSGVASALVDDIAAAGMAAILVEQTDGTASFDKGRYRVNPARAQDVRMLFSAIAKTHGAEPQAVVCLAAIDENRDADFTADWDACMTRFCGSVLHLLQALAADDIRPQRGVWVVTRGAQPVMMDEASALSVAQAPLWGLGRVAAREMPDIWGGLVDLDISADPSFDVNALRRAIEGEDGESQIVVRGVDRFVARLVETPLEANAAPTFRDNHSYLIVGGLGGIGLQTARWMVDHGARHLTLSSRTGPQSANESATADVLRELEAAGATIAVEAADSTDRKRMATLFATFGDDRPPLAGIIHTAAVVDFQPIEDIGLEQFLVALRAKVAGSWILHELSADLELDFLLLFSSMAAIGGFPHLSHYAAGNCFMDALGHHRRQLGLPAQSINWGLWSEGRATTDENKALFERIGLRAMPSSEALRGLALAMSTDTPQLTVASVDWQTFRPIYESRGAGRFLSRLSAQAEPSLVETPQIQASPQSALRSELDAADPVTAARLLDTAVCETVAAILGISVDQVTDRSEGFFQMGMDSIMTVELRRRLETRLGLDLPTTLAFEYSTIERLTEFLAGELLDVGTKPEHAGATTDTTAPNDADDDDLDELSETELAAELDRELAALDDNGRSRTS